MVDLIKNKFGIIDVIIFSINLSKFAKFNLGYPNTTLESLPTIPG